MSTQTAEALVFFSLFPIFTILCVVAERLSRVRIRRQVVMRNIGRAGIPKHDRMWMWDDE